MEMRPFIGTSAVRARGDVALPARQRRQPRRPELGDRVARGARRGRARARLPRLRPVRGQAVREPACTPTRAPPTRGSRRAGRRSASSCSASRSAAVPACELGAHAARSRSSLHSTFTSVPDMAKCMFPCLPARLLARTRFDNLGKVPKTCAEHVRDLAAQSGAPPDLIAPVMGHADTRMVERIYGRLPAARPTPALGTHIELPPRTPRRARSGFTTIIGSTYSRVVGLPRISFRLLLAVLLGVSAGCDDEPSASVTAGLGPVTPARTLSPMRSTPWSKPAILLGRRLRVRRRVGLQRRPLPRARAASASRQPVADAGASFEPVAGRADHAERVRAGPRLSLARGLRRARATRRCA